MAISPPHVLTICWTSAHKWQRSVGKFQRVLCLGFVTAPTLLNRRQPNFVRCLAVSCAGTLHVHFPGLLPPNGILPAAKFTLRPNLALSYYGSINARHSSTGRQPNFMAFSREHQLYSAGRPSRWASAHILVHSYVAGEPGLADCSLVVFHHLFHTCATLLALKQQQPFHQEVSCGWRKDEARPLVMDSALCSSQCFDTDGSVAGRAPGP